MLLSPRSFCIINDIHSRPGSAGWITMGKLTVTIFSNLAQVFLFGTGLFYFLLSFRGFWRGQRTAAAGKRLRFALLLPAHNEEGVVGLAVESLAGLNYPRELFDIFVVADHCTDGTVRAAAAAGAKVLEHSGPGLKAGKGRAMKWATAEILAGGNYDAFCYFDADSLAHPAFLEAMNARLAAGDIAIQGRQLAKNTGCLLAKILASGHYITNRLFQLPKQALGLSATLHGKGMCFTAEIARKHHWDETCLTEDLEMQMRLIRHGVRISWAGDAVVYDEEPETLSQYMCRTIRWTRGSLDTARRHLPGLLSRALGRGDIRAFEGALYCAQTYRFVVVTLGAALLWFSRDSFNLVLWLYGQLPGMEHTMKALSLVPLFFYPATALVIEKARPDLAAAYFLQPLLGILRLPIFVAGVLRGTDFWGRTEHTSRVAIADLVD